MTTIHGVGSAARFPRPISTHTIDAIQLRQKKNAKKPEHLCLLILGERGSGRSTFLANLCNYPDYTQSQAAEVCDPRRSHIAQKLKIIKKHLDLSSHINAPMILDLVIMEGFGDNFDNSGTSATISAYLNTQFENYLAEEEKIHRTGIIEDTRSHACLYFIKPNMRGLNDFDIEVLKKIQKQVNIIPILTKADILSQPELVSNKEIIKRQLRDNNIEIYDFGNDRIGDVFSCNDMHPFDKYTRSQNINEMVPFATTCSKLKYVHPWTAETLHIRKYSWGELIVEDFSNSEFAYLKGILFGSHVQELRNFTQNVLYETFRARKLLERRSAIVESNSIQQDIHHSMHRIVGLHFKQSDNSSKLSPNKLKDEKDQLLLDYERKLRDLETRLNSQQSKSTMSSIP